MEPKKICKTCRIEKPLTEFRRDKRRASTWTTECLECLRAKGRKYAEANREKNTTRSNEWQKKNPERSRQSTANWRARNPGASATQAREARRADPEKFRKRDRDAYWKDPQKANARKNAGKRKRYRADIAASRAKNRAKYATRREYIKSLVHAHRAKKLGFVGRYVISVIAELLRLQKGRCAYCRKDIRHSYHIDHIKPASKGGLNEGRNLQLLCKSCNSSKGAKDPLDFARKRGLLL